MTEPRPPTPGLLRREIWPRTIRNGFTSISVRIAQSFIRQRAAAELISTAALPDELRAIVSLTVKRTRLWGSERLDIARELAAHFADGLESGRAADQLITDFGNPSRAAKLIRRSKLRGRPLWWRSCNHAARAFAAVTLILLVAYLVLAYRYYFGRPTLTHNYAAELNAPVLATPVDQRAWPVYIQAAKALGPTPQFILDGKSWPTRAGDPAWDAAAAHLAAHPEAVPTIRRAAAMQTLGFIYRNTSDPDYQRALEVRDPDYRFDPTTESPMENPFMIGILLPYLGEFRNMSRILQFDIAASAAAGDHARIVADLEAMLGIAAHCLQSGLLIDTQVGIAIAEVAAQAALRNLPLLTDDELSATAHRFAAFAGGRIRITPDSEVKMFDDLIQRFFTDDGHGDGHIIQGNLKQLRIDFGLSEDEVRRLSRFKTLFRSAMVSSRAQLMAQHDQILATVRADEALPLWKHDQRSNVWGLGDLYDKNLNFMFPFESLFQDPSQTFQRLFIDRDLFEAERGALLAACAIESYHRAHHAWPADLSTLVPALLPSLPVDPFDGKPLRYKVSADGPLLYSIGVDQVDGGGQLPTDSNEPEKVCDARRLKAFRNPTPGENLDSFRGDWIIYPPPAIQSKP